MPGGPLGMAEGIEIETAPAVSSIFEMPVRSAINSTQPEKWMPPEGCEEVVLIGDNDLEHGGQAAAFRLACKLAARKITVTVRIPEIPGTHWNDERLGRTAKGKVA